MLQRSLIPLCLLLLAVRIPVIAQATPSLSCRGEIPALTIPPAWQAMISARFPGFQAFRFTDYHRYVRRPCSPTRPTAPFALVADLDHDSVLDLVVEGQDLDSARVVAVLSQRGRPLLLSAWVRPTLAPGTIQYDDDVGLWWELRHDRLTAEIGPHASDRGLYLFQINRIEHGMVRVYWSGEATVEEDVPPGD